MYFTVILSGNATGAGAERSPISFWTAYRGRGFLDKLGMTARTGGFLDKLGMTEKQASR